MFFNDNQQKGIHMNQPAFQTVDKGSVTLYCCGGAAINIGGQLSSVTINPDLMADITTVLIDTSRSNLTPRSANVECYLVDDGLDGSGKVRTENSEVIAERVKDILKHHAAGDLNIVLGSGAGGSGSVIAPYLTSELLLRGEKVVVLMVGSIASKKEAENTLKTFMSYEGIAQLRQKPVVMHYLQNSKTMPRSQVDEQMVSTISFLAILFSRRNSELDTMDLENWLHYTKPEVTQHFAPQLVSLNILWYKEGDDQLERDLSDLGNVISVATLGAVKGVNTDLPVVPEYQTVGFVPPLKDSTQFLGDKLINYIISDGLVARVAQDLQEFLSAPPPRQASNSLLSVGVKVGKGGVVL